MERLGKITNRLLSIIAICVCVCVALFSLVGCGGESKGAEKGRKTSFAPSSCESECAALSETDILEGTDNGDGAAYMLSDYTDMVKGGKINEKTNTQLLYKIIPEQYFVNECEYFHKGVAYSFYIKTTKSDVYSSEVAIVPHKLNVEERYAYASLELSVFSNTYYTKPATSKKDSVCYSVGVSMSKYYLRDVQFYCGYEYVDAPNYGDADYSQLDDDGDVIGYLIADYRGIKEYGKDGTIKPLSYFGTIALFSHVPLYDDYSKLYKGTKSYKQWDAAIKDYMPSDKAMAYSVNEQMTRSGKSSQQKSGKGYYERFAVVAYDNTNMLIGGKANCFFATNGTYGFNGLHDARVFFEADYNLFVDPVLGKDQIIMSDGSSKAYTKSLSGSAQFHCRREQVMRV
ncbi:MAG: hypothetical protein K2M47_07040 [Clostridiales bacterium]|nr:hypothetical protein [Clostridiales bacterium]